VELTSQIYKSKSVGMDLWALRELLGASTLDVRSGCRLLQKYKAAVPFLEDKRDGRLR
jgi:hypothetical protein